MYSTMFWCLLVVLLDFLALLHNHCYSLHKTKLRLVISIWQGPGPVATKMPTFLAFLLRLVQDSFLFISLMKKLGLTLFSVRRSH